MNNAWYSVLSMLFSYLALAIAGIISALALRKSLSDVALRRRVRRHLPEAGRAGTLRVLSESRGSLRAGQEITVPYEGSIGALPSCDIRLPVSVCGLRSAFFWYERDGLHLSPSVRKRYSVDGAALRPGDEAILEDGALLRVGGVELVFRLTSSKPVSAANAEQKTREEKAEKPQFKKEQPKKRPARKTDKPQAKQNASKKKAASDKKTNSTGKPQNKIKSIEKAKTVISQKRAEAEKRRQERAKLREKRKTDRERIRRDAIARDRRRAVSKKGGVTLIALLTMLFEALGLSLVSLRGGVFEPQALLVAAAIVPLGLIFSLLLPRRLPVDSLLMALVNFLCGVGIVILYTVSPARGVRQAMFYAVGLALMLLVSLAVSRLRRWRLVTFISMLLGLGALLLPLLLGEWQYGAKNWVSLPLLGSLQPSEFVKLSLVLSLAYFMSLRGARSGAFPSLLFAALCLALLMLQRDLGTALVYYATTLMLFYVATGNLPLTVAGLGGGALSAMAGYRLFAHVRARVAMWRNPWSDPLDKGYQIIQGLLAIGSGGLFGMGLGQGTPEKIPAYFNDFIFAVVCEQMGLIFGLIVLAMYPLILLRGASLCMGCRRSFHMLLGCGVLAVLGVQTFMIVGGVVKLIPLTGVTMPFLSHGGSSLLSCLMLVGVLHGIGAAQQEELVEDILSEGKAR